MIVRLSTRQYDCSASAQCETLSRCIDVHVHGCNPMNCYPSMWRSLSGVVSNPHSKRRLEVSLGIIGYVEKVNLIGETKATEDKYLHQRIMKLFCLGI